MYVAVAGGVTKPVISTFDCRMIQVLPTSREPIRSFVDRVRAMQGKDGILAISVIHRFMAAEIVYVAAPSCYPVDPRETP